MEQGVNIPKLLNQIRRARTLADQAQHLEATVFSIKDLLTQDPNFWVRVGLTSKPQVLEPSTETQVLAMAFMEDREDCTARAKKPVKSQSKLVKRKAV